MNHLDTLAVSGRVENLFCRRLLILALSILPGFLLHGAETGVPLAVYRYTRTVKPEKVSPSGFYTLTADDKFYSAVNDLSREICLTGEDNRPLPFTLQQVTAAPAVPPEQQVSGRILREQQLPDGRHALDIELASEVQKITSLELVGGYFSHKALFSIAVGDGRNWQTALDKYPLTGTARLPEPVNRRFPFARPMKGKFLRLILEKEHFTALEAVRIYAVNPQPVPEVPQNRPTELTELSRKSDQAGVTVISSGGNLPLTGIRITSESPLYYCQVVIFGSSDRRNWTQIAAGNIRKVDLDVSDTVNFPESRFRFIRIRINPVKNMELQGLKISSFISNKRWVFYAPEPAEKFTIYYAPSVPVPLVSNHVMPEIDLAQAVSCSVGKPAPNTLRRAGVRDRDSLNYLIGAVLTALAGIGILIVFASLKRSQNILPAD